MSLLENFKAFAVKVKGDVGNLVVAMIIGGAFGKIVTSLVGDLIVPIAGDVIGKSGITPQHRIPRLTTRHSAGVTTNVPTPA